MKFSRRCRRHTDSSNHSLLPLPILNQIQQQQRQPLLSLLLRFTILTTCAEKCSFFASAAYQREDTDDDFTPDEDHALDLLDILDFFDGTLPYIIAGGVLLLSLHVLIQPSQRKRDMDMDGMVR